MEASELSALSWDCYLGGRASRNHVRELLAKHCEEHRRYIYEENIKQAFSKWKEDKKMRLFEYAAFYTAAEKGEKSVVVVEPKTVLAKTEDIARTLAAKAIPDEYNDKLDRVTIVVRPFV